MINNDLEKTVISFRSEPGYGCEVSGVDEVRKCYKTPSTTYRLTANSTLVDFLLVADRRATTTDILAGGVRYNISTSRFYFS